MKMLWSCTKDKETDFSSSMSKDHLYIPFLNSTSMHMQAFRGSIKGLLSYYNALVINTSWRRHNDYLRGSSFRRCARYHDRLASHVPYRHKWGVGKLVCRRGNDQRSIDLERLRSFRKVGNICLNMNFEKWPCKLDGHFWTGDSNCEKHIQRVTSKIVALPVSNDYKLCSLF